MWQKTSPLVRNIMLIVLLSSLHFLPSTAQTDNPNKKSRDIRFSRHSLSFGFGLVPENKQFQSDLFTQGTFGDLFYLSHYTLGDMTTTGAINLNYSYNFSKHITIGSFVSYINYSRDINENKSNSKYGDAVERNADMTPRFTYFWHNKNIFRLYSGIGVSFGYKWIKYNFLETHYSSREFEWKPQLTLIGIQAGRRVYGFGEANLKGRLGYLNMGLGYRFGKVR